ncbi:hypothetical protein MBLNU459_g8397t1 [Dothideomycetes sp. NU459]
MAHRRVKDIDYDEDELDEYSDNEYAEEGGEDELSLEDKEQMRAGTAKVKEALGDAFPVSDQAIQDALWHYFYDIGKSVSYLKNKSAPQQQQPKKQKQESKFDQAATFAAQTPIKSKNDYGGAFPNVTNPHRHITAADYFKDVPWFNVPPDKSGTILIESLLPPLRLMGGSAQAGGKPSKLAALAAARKKKEAEQKANVESGDQKPGVVSLLDRLSTKAQQTTPNQLDKQPDQPPAALEQSTRRAFPFRKRKGSSSPPIQRQAEQTPKTEPIEPQSDAAPVQNLRALPSVFATTMCGGSAQRLSTAANAPRSTQDIAPAIFGRDANLANKNPFAGPSPDDIVVQAQAKGAKKHSNQQKDAKSVSGVTDGVSSMGMNDSTPAPKVKSKNLDVVAEYEKAASKNAASFVVIGHVDHGKSTLMGRLLYDLKVVDQRSIDKFRKEATTLGKSSFALAWVMDSTSEERERGVTVDIAMNHFETAKTKFTILDAPGHRDFIPNMIAGASQADFAVLVIDAGTNSFESGLKGQTKEHALLVRSMGVQRIIIAINKMDSVQWDQDRFEEIKQQLSAFLTTAGFQPKNIVFIPCSGLTGENVVGKAPEAADWYTKSSSPQTLVEALESYEPTKTSLTLPLRLPISDIFRGGVTNPLSISGKIDAGSLQVGDSLLAMPAGETATIKGIEIDNEAADWAVAGQIVTLHLNDIDPIHLRIADVLCDVRKPIQNIKTFTTKILAFEHILPMQVDVHRGRMHVPGRITQMIAVLDKASGAVIKKKPRVVQPGSVARVVVELDSAVPLEVPSRVVLRAGGATLAAGLLEQVQQ